MKEFKLTIGANDFNGQGLLFTSFSCNGLFYWDVKENRMYALGEFERDPIWKKEMFYAAVRWKKDIFFPPYMAHGIPYFDTDTGEIGYCGLPSYLINRTLNYYGYVQRGHLLYLFPVHPMEEVLVLDMDRRKLSKSEPGWNKHITGRFSGRVIPFLTGFFCQGGTIWMHFEKMHEVFEIEVDTWDVRIHTWEEIEWPEIIQTNDAGFWLGDVKNGSICHVDTDGRGIEQYDIRTKSTERGFSTVSRVVRLGHGERLVLPLFSDEIFIIKEDGAVCRAQLPEDADTGNKMYLCCYYLEFEEEVWLLPHSQNDMVIMNLRDYSLRVEAIPAPDGWEERSRFCLKMQSIDRGFTIEGDGSGVSQTDFCAFITGQKEEHAKETIIPGCGNAIWQCVNGRRAGG